ncbi:Holliday junction branch migration DNA helicase RuvB [Mycoplasmopsis pullorum]|uniref:Holliday junction branch migration complex subunit RuvB n=1 Tax=Mycoplasmopsis pullorum TaxID=48003 RepID=A0A1L4FRJ4_9BACT|nr:Holliday junction branch migration DNA helicase RuvB [Mycoplasmopsis pullorum]APJ38230.1 Holliday junction DNA helicase RuvB [Mycoplasmopsis pullorum]
MQKDIQPKTFSDFIGQNRLITTIKAMIDNAERKNQSLDHLLFYGPPGLGKTTLANIIANQLNVKVHQIQAGILEKKSDLIALLTNVNENDIIFIDEIHSLNKTIEESLYSAMEYFTFNMTFGVDGNQKIIKMKLKKFTLIGATTKIHSLSKPLKERFGLISFFQQYSFDEICKIITISARKLSIEIDEEAIKLIAEFSRSTPRIANHLLKRCDDFSAKMNKNLISKEVVNKTFKFIELYQHGLTREHLEYLNLLRENFNEKWVSLQTITAILSTSKDQLIEDIESILLQEKYIEKSSKGRRITSLGINYLIKNFKLTNTV